MNCTSSYTLTVSQRPLTELLDRDYPAVESGTIAGGRASRATCPSNPPTKLMIESFARVSGWEQLWYLWELIVMVCKFLWGLLRLLGGG